jgi:hypothetical protein
MLTMAFSRRFFLLSHQPRVAKVQYIDESEREQKEVWALSTEIERENFHKLLHPLLLYAKVQKN